MPKPDRGSPDAPFSCWDRTDSLKIGKYVNLSILYVEDSPEIPYTLRVAHSLMTTNRVVLAYSREGA
jgi:hypothetical protein